MGGGKGGGSKGGGSKKKKTAVQKKAAVRHANFKKTAKETGRRVQTLVVQGRNTVKQMQELSRKHMEDLRFARVTGGAANPLNRAPTTENVKSGDIRPEIKT